MELLQAVLLFLAAGASAVLIGRARRRYGEAHQPALFSAMLGFILASASGACGAASLIGINLDEAHQWLERASLLLGLPLIAVAALTLARRWTWSRPNWGRVVLGLCVFFELARQLGWSEPYALGLMLISALLVIYAGALQWPASLPTAAGLAAGVLLLGSAPLPAGVLTDNPLSELRPLLLAIASPLIVALLVRLPGSIGEDRPAVA
ncbi:hypothetical protein NAU58_00820 [Pseudomonas stutzeri]|uniref:Uncharacterized protein n=1 Tax=Stutzerimonas stutzeri TaxID=316 RepID=A0A2N8S4G7_STUST|nr:hypothetical protein [Stutzerimonas stutzeri]MCQ4294105.1 hypothetical protein [Stutzerimonas stutzeri]PNF81502.1 hypothetical protein CXK92_06620 [Stutzerimonas stutzeri]